ncbi:MAG: ACP S-malonyltransferase [Chloroflexi bacterium]|nr:MAG: ACP S-malonyltransferase [Chloroflexota bacterium]
MGTDLRAASADARAIFALTDGITALPITRLCEEGPLERLTETDIAQPAVVATSLAALAVLRERLVLKPDAVAGHSVGEFAAYVAAGVLDARAALELVHTRAQAMAAACKTVDGSMAAVIGLDEARLREACAAASQNGSSVELANLNSPGQLIVSGARDAIQRVAEQARAAGARRILPLNVGGPFHSVYMRPAAHALASAFAARTLRRAEIPVVLNCSAEVTRDPGALRQELEVQVYSPVRWVETLQRLAELGCDRFLEVGPGQVLTGLVRRTLPDVKAASFGALADLDAAAALVA